MFLLLLLLLLITDNIELDKQNTALVFDSCNIFQSSGDIVYYQPQTVKLYKYIHVYQHPYPETQNICLFCFSA